MKKVRHFYTNGQTFLLISSDLFVQKVRPFHIKGLTLNTSPPQPTETDPAVIQRLHPGAMVETPGKVWAKSGQDLGKVWARLVQSLGKTCAKLGQDFGKAWARQGQTMRSAKDARGARRANPPLSLAPLLRHQPVLRFTGR